MGRGGNDVSGIQSQIEEHAVRGRVTIALAFALVLSVIPAVFAQGVEGIEIVHVRGPIYLLAGAGANITVSAGPDGVLLVDSGAAQSSDSVLRAIRELQRQITTAE